MAAPLTLDIQEIASGGEAVGRTPDGLVVFVPGGAPGDRAEVALVEQRRGWARGALRRLLVPGPDRVAPPCAEAGRCGGCPLMHLARPAQLAAKEAWVRRALRRTGAAVRPILSPAPDLGYRVRARLTLRGGRLGFLTARSHEVVDLGACPVLAPALDEALFRAAARLRPVLGEGGALSGLLGRSGAVHLAVETGAGGDRVRAEAIVAALLAEGVCAGAVVDGRQSGAPAVDLGDETHGPLLATADGFAQASAAGHGTLVELVLEALGAPAEGWPWPRLLELYAGSGNLTRVLRRHAAAVVAVEGEPRAAARLRALGVEVLAEPAEHAVRRLGAGGARFPAVVLDPPRTGAREVVADLAELGPERVVYVSCDPMTLGRDLEVLEKSGMSTIYAQPVDLVPHAAHVEIVAVLTTSRMTDGAAAPDRAGRRDR